MLGTLLERIPPPVVRAVGRWQFKLAPIRWLIERSTARLTQRTGVIAHGIGAGLRFDATGGQLGFLLGTTEPEEQAALAQHLVSRGVFYDIGANIGFYSTLAGRLVGPHGRVYGFEPTPTSAARARRNAELNGFAHIEIVEAAASDVNGRLTLAVDGGSTTNRLTTSGDGIEVAVITIDTWRVQTGAHPPTVVMIDVEGAELAVLGGMLQTIRQYKPIILCEVHWIGPEFGEFVNRELRPVGYTLSPLPGEAAAELTRWHAVLMPRNSQFL